MKRHSHYERAFEDYLRGRGVPLVPVNESRRVELSEARIKSFDFIVYPGGDRQWIVDVKGRRFPYRTARGGVRYWENWVTQNDLDGLAEWQAVFGSEFEARFVFAYQLEGPPDRWPAGRPHSFDDANYAFLTITLAEYQAHARRRSPKWGTVNIGQRIFRQLATPVGSLLRQTERQAII